jgi:mono/diheme cytochrome c family protein
MMADDHNRAWKEYQRKFITLDSWTTKARMSEAESATYHEKLQQLKAELAAAQSTFTPADRDNVEKFLGLALHYDDEFAKLVTEYHKDVSVVPDQAKAKEIDVQANQLVEVKEPEVIRKGRSKILAGLNDLLAKFTFREDHFIQETKDKRAYFSEAQSLFDQAVGQGHSPGELVERQKVVDAANKEVDISNKLTQRAIEQRQELERVLKLITAAEDKAAKALKDHENTVDQLGKAVYERSLNFGKDLLTMPILDAFNSPLKDANRWLPQLPWNVNFRTVARFDRCETCHMGMEKSLPGEPTKPAFPTTHLLSLELPTPAKRPAPPAEASSADKKKDAAAVDPSELARVYGVRLAETGVFSTSDVTVSAVYPESTAAVAGLMPGDVIKMIGDAQIIRPSQAQMFLLENVNWGQPLKLTVSRGVPHPYTSHPRLDLFVGSVSPHPVDKFGCSICHQGQGSETSFSWATHTPNTPEQGNKWAQDYHWFENENWTYPMFPKRFQESTCLKCHHEVVDLEPSRKFPDPPAPKLVEGYETIRRYGCFGCHEINGFAGPQQRIGPDLRLEPNYFAAAAQLEVDPGLSKLAPDAKALADEVASHPDHDSARRRLHDLVAIDTTAKHPELDAASHKLESVLRDLDAPGNIRKVGPSLRHVKSKLGFDFLTSWIANPKEFRPDTRMPRFFGVWDHLDPNSRGLAESQRLEPVEIRAIAEYLLKSSQPFEYLPPPAAGKSDENGGDDHAASIARGKKVFEVRGCLACHKHADFPKGMATQGPDLSRIGAKLASNPDGRKWLDSWVRNPSRYHLRTYMPNLFLEPTEDAKGAKTDPAADVTEFLMNSQQGWKPVGALKRELTKDDETAIEDLAVEYLSEKFPRDRALQYVTDGIPAGQAESVQGDEAVLVNLKLTGLAVRQPGSQSETAEHRQQRLTRELDYIGRRSIGKYGCFGCHDIPGYEDAKPIGTALNDWGRKDPARLAFEHVDEYLEAHKNMFVPGAKTPEAPAHDVAAKPGAKPTAAEHEMQAEAEEEPTLKDLVDRLPPDLSYFLGRVFEEDRIGFLWEKLRAPRSYDYKKTEEKKYNERLRMPQFTFAVETAENQRKIESVMTFVLGLVAEPPPADYVAAPTGRQEAIVAGRKVLEQFNCAGCHMLEMERWEISYEPGAFGPPPKTGAEYSFVLPHYTPQDMQKADTIDRRGQRRATLVGMPLLDYHDGKPLKLDEDGSPIEAGDTATKAFTPFMLFENALVDGATRLIGAQNLRVADTQIVRQYPSRGGDLAKLLFPVVVADEIKINPAAKDKPNEAWGWLPPPLAGEGRKVQSEWLHNFLLDPFQIRPAAVLRMPKFNMSSGEASTLVHYFAAIDDAEYPYEFDARTRSEHVEALEDAHPHYLEQALGIVTDNNYCIKCHKVGDFSPTGNVRAMAPRLDRVHSRLRPEYAHRWIADPVRTLPYTGMPVNIPLDKPIDQKLFAGSSDQQLNAVVDLLMNFDRLAQSQMSIKSRIKPAAPAAGNSSTQSTSGSRENAAATAVSKRDSDEPDDNNPKSSKKTSDAGGSGPKPGDRKEPE